MKKDVKVGTIGKGIGCAVLLFISLFPIYWLIAMAIRPTSEMEGSISLFPRSLTFEYFVDLFQNEGFGQAILNSAQTTFGSLVISLLVGICAAYVIARKRFQFGMKQPMTYWVLLIRVLPPVAFVIPLYIMFNQIGLINTKIPVLLACVLINVPLIIWFLLSFFQDLPDWKYPVLGFLAGALSFYIILLIIKILRALFSRTKKNKKEKGEENIE